MARPRSFSPITLGLAATLIAAAACSSDRADDEAGSTAGASTTESTEPFLVPRTDVVEALDSLEPPPTGSDGESDDESIGTAESIEPVPDTGVPGIESSDAFCRSWSEYAGSYQAITFGWAFREPGDAARLEVAASGALITGAAGMAEHLPTELEGERVALTVELVAPLLRRATRSTDYLAALGVDPAAQDELRTAWLEALTSSGLDDVDMVVEVPDAVGDDRLDAAAGQLVGELPPIVEDPTLIVDIEVPETEAYLAANCPDRGVLLGNDVIDG